MPLRPSARRAFPDIGRIGFQAVDNAGNPVAVYVTFEALDTKEPEALDGHLAIFGRNQAAVEWIAGRNYDAGMIEPDGSVLVTSADLND